jgi:hypothetical protein
MAHRASTLIAAMIATIMMVAAMWTWQQASHLAFDADQPDVVLWAARSAAIAAAAMAQGIILFLVVGRVYRTRAIDLVLRLIAASVFAVALISAVVLALAGR